MSALKSVLLALALASFALTAQAAGVQTNLNYSLAASDPSVLGYFINGQPCQYSSGDITPNRYRTVTMQVTTAGTYTFNDQYGVSSGYNNGDLGIYSGTFNPNNPLANCVGTVDDSQAVSLGVGTYTLIVSSFLGIDPNGIPGDFYYTITGPDSVTLQSGTVTPTPPAVSAPTLTEWGMMILALCAACMGLRRLQRKA